MSENKIPSEIIDYLTQKFVYPKVKANKLIAAFSAAGIMLDFDYNSKVMQIGFERMQTKPQPLIGFGRFLKSMGLGDSDEVLSELMQENGLVYKDGAVYETSAQVALTLTEQIKQEGIPAVQKEIERVTERLNNGDLSAALHRAVTLLESVYKAYLDRNQQPYNESAAAAELWKQVAEHLNIRPGQQKSPEWKAIFSSLYQIAQNMAQLRNQHGGHGQNQTQHMTTEEITSAQARLAVNAAASLATYIMEA